MSGIKNEGCGVPDAWILALPSCRIRSTHGGRPERRSDRRVESGCLNRESVVNNVNIATIMG